MASSLRLSSYNSFSKSSELGIGRLAASSNSGCFSFGFFFIGYKKRTEKLIKEVFFVMSCEFTII